LLHKEKKEYKRGRERPLLAVLADRRMGVYLEPITMAAQKRVVSCLQLLPQVRTGYDQDCRQSPRVCINCTVYIPKPEEPKKDKKRTKREAGICHKMELAEIRLRFVDTW
jgi:hypothetical protein